MAQAINFNQFFRFFFICLNVIISSRADCPLGYAKSNNPSFCYKFYGGPSNFFDAETKCQSIQNGHLASIANGFVNSFLSEYSKDILSDSSIPIWLGGEKLTSNWTWSDNQPFTYQNWAKGQPGNSGQCMTISVTDGKWYSNDCQNQLGPFLCEAPDSSIPTPTPTIQVTYPCDSTWTYFNYTNFCYKLYHNQTFNDGESTCVKNGGHLTSIHSLVENEFIIEFSRAGLTFFENSTVIFWPSTHVWIGLTDPNEDEIYTWTDGTPLDFSQWAPGQPTGEDPRLCVSLGADPLDPPVDFFQKWHQEFCNFTMRAFPCKKPSNLKQILLN